MRLIGAAEIASHRVKAGAKWPSLAGCCGNEEFASMLRGLKLRSDEEANWDEAFKLHQELVRSYLGYLIDCSCSDTILEQIETEIRDTHVPDEFKLRFMLRTMVRTTVQHIRECSHTPRVSSWARNDSKRPAIPTQERLVYFLRDILEYSTRDTSLLIGISDAQAENLLLLARKRMDMVEGPSSFTIQAPHGMYFKWRFRSFHLH